MKAVPWSALALLLVLEAVPLAGILALAPTAPRPADAPLEEFSAERAMVHVRMIAREPHPPGTAEHGRVREYLVGQLLGLELETQVQAAGGLENIVARLRGTAATGGTGGTKAVLLAAHYDSVPEGPGAGDDASGVAVLLETARALKAGAAPRRNDMIFLITDGEELGLLGANEFIIGHPWASEVGLVLNFEARGNSGPSIMFETSDGNGPLIRELARLVRRPVASSLSSTVYRRLPQDTDFTLFRKAGMPGYNFAMIDGLPAYHSRLDTADNLSRASVQHHGDQALALARGFAGSSLEGLAGRNAVYFSFAWLFIRYPEGWALPLAALACLLGWGLLAVCVHRGLATKAGLWRGALAALSVLIDVVGAPAIALWTARWLLQRVGAYPTLEPRGENLASELLAFAAWNMVLALTLFFFNRRKLALAEIAGGTLALLTLGQLAAAIAAPGGSYLLTWPVLASIASLASALWLERPLVRNAALILAALPALLILVPASYMFLLTFAYDSVLALLVALPPAALALELLFPQLRALGQAAPRLLPCAALALAILSAILACFAPRFA